MVDAGISAQAAIGGFEQAFGSKPRSLCVSVFGRLAAASGGGTEGGSIFIDGEGVATVTTNDTSSPTTELSATVSYGAGSIVLGGATAGVVSGEWVIGTGEDDDTLDIFMAHGDFAARDAAAYVAAGTGALPGTLNITSINGGTVSFILSCPHEDSDDLANGDGFKISLWAYARGGV